MLRPITNLKLNL